MAARPRMMPVVFAADLAIMLMAVVTPKQRIAQVSGQNLTISISSTPFLKFAPCFNHQAIAVELHHLMFVVYAADLATTRMDVVTLKQRTAEVPQ